MRGRTADESVETGPARDAPPSSKPWHGIPTATARRFYQICAARSSEVVGAAGLTPLQYGAILHLERAGARPGIEQGVLADRLNVDRNTASLVVEQLVKMGLVSRQVNEADRRARLLSLTAKGAKLYAGLTPAFTAANESIMAPISPHERKVLMALLIRVIEGNLLRHDGGQRRLSVSRRKSRTDQA
jgi:DNA-binding MarR family transcriptional regulator